MNHGPVNSNGFTFDDKILADADVQSAIASHKSARKSYQITNTDRSSFSRISGVLAQKYGDAGFKGRLQFDLTGASGQSFCAFLGQGMEVTLSGYANDYVGKGMAGGKITVRPPSSDLATVTKAGFSMVGNTVLYGATGGELFVRGRGGERFAVRNSGATGVIEGLGDHGCEYMTAGYIINLGSTGRNFGAGMTGGLAFILPDEEWMEQGASKTFADDSLASFSAFVNTETVSVKKLTASNANAVAFLRSHLERHVQETGSRRATFLLSNFDRAIEKFLVVVPASEKSNPLLSEVSEWINTCSRLHSWVVYIECFLITFSASLTL